MPAAQPAVLGARQRHVRPGHSCIGDYCRCCRFFRGIAVDFRHNSRFHSLSLSPPRALIIRILRHRLCALRVLFSISDLSASSSSIELLRRSDDGSDDDDVDVCMVETVEAAEDAATAAAAVLSAAALLGVAAAEDAEEDDVGMGEVGGGEEERGGRAQRRADGREGKRKSK